MPLTNRGVWYPDVTSSPNPISLGTSTATSVQAALDSLALNEAVPRFASATLRDAAYTASGVAIQAGQVCAVAGVLNIYNGTAWVLQNAAAAMAIASYATATNVGISAWAKQGWGSTDYYDPTASMSVGPTGIGFAFTGWAQFEGTCVIGGSASGTRRLIGVGPATGAAPVGMTPSFAPAGTNAVGMSVVQTLPVTYGDVWTLWAYQDAGTLSCVTRRLVARRVV
jgi:hypothetical protein